MSTTAFLMTSDPLHRDPRFDQGPDLIDAFGGDGEDLGNDTGNDDE